MPHDEFSAEDLLGQVVDDRFEILEKLGEGGMGAIYKARQISMDRVVALKILLHDQRGDPISVERFRHEAYLASRLKHPNAIIIHDFGNTADGLLYIAMEYLSGETLKERLARVGALQVNSAVKIMTQALRTIAEAHRTGLIHRDLKPDNIFLTTVEGDEDFVKVLDFGIAKLTAVQEGFQGAEGYQGGLTMAGKIYGTPNYMSPEQIRGKEVDQQSDLYSLGVIFYEMLAGQLPFIASTPVDVMMMHLRDAPPPVTSIQPGCPVELERTVLRALEKDRRVRYRSADEFLEAVENYKFNSGFYAVPARLAAMATSTENEAIQLAHTPHDDSDDSEDEPGPTLMLEEGATPPVATGPLFADDPDVFTADSLPGQSYGSLEDEDDDATVGVPLPQIDDDERTMLEDPEALLEASVPELADWGDEDSVVASSPALSGSFSGGTPAPPSPPAPAPSPPSPEEMTMLELDDDDLEDVEPSRIVPIPEFDDSFGGGGMGDDYGAPMVPGIDGRPRPTFSLEPAQANKLMADAGRPAGPIHRPKASAPVAPTPLPPTPRISAPVPVAPRPSAPMPAAPRPSMPMPAAPRPSAPMPAASRPAPMVAPMQPQAAMAQAAVAVPGLPVGARSGGGKGKLIALVLALLVVVGGGVAAVLVFAPFGGGTEAPADLGPPKVVFNIEPPGVEVFDHGRFRGETPIEYELESDKVEHDIQIAAGRRTLKAKVGAQKGPGWLYVMVPDDGKQLAAAVVLSTPPGASAKIDGKDVGRTPLTVLGKPGAALTVELTGDGGQTGSAQVVLAEPAQQAEVSLE